MVGQQPEPNPQICPCDVPSQSLKVFGFFWKEGGIPVGHIHPHWMLSSWPRWRSCAAPASLELLLSHALEQLEQGWDLPPCLKDKENQKLYLVLKELFGITKLISACPHLVQLDEHMGLGTWGSSKPKTQIAFSLHFPCDCIEEQEPEVNRAGLKGRAREQLVQKHFNFCIPSPSPQISLPSHRSRSASVQTG